MASGRIPADPEGPGHFRDPVQPDVEPPRPFGPDADRYWVGVLGSPASRLQIPRTAPAIDSTTISQIVRASGWESLKSLALALLGSQSHALGIAYGLAEGGWGVIAGLLDFLTMIVLEGVYERIHGPLGNWNPIERAESRALDYVLHSHLETAHREYMHLVEELRRVVSNPREFFGNAWNSEKNEYSQKWQRYQWLMGHRSIANEFEAGRIEGQTILEVALLLATVIDGVGLALKGAKALGELPELARLTAGVAKENLQKVPALARLANGVSKEKAESLLKALREKLRTGGGTVDEAQTAAAGASAGGSAAKPPKPKLTEEPAAATKEPSSPPLADPMKLAAALRAAPNGSAERAALADEFAKISTHVKEPANRVVLGKWEEGGGYVAEAQKNGGVWYETPADTYGVMGKEAAWDTNEAFLKQQMATGKPVEFTGMSEDEVSSALDDLSARGQAIESARARIREFVFMQNNASNYGYVQQGMRFVKAP